MVPGMKTRPEEAKQVKKSLEGNCPLPQRRAMHRHGGVVGLRQQEGQVGAPMENKDSTVYGGFFGEEQAAVLCPPFPSQGRVPSLCGQLLTSPHAAQRHQPPLWDSGKHYCHTVPTLQATGPRENIGCLLTDFTQFSEAPLYFFPTAIHPP